MAVTAAQVKAFAPEFTDTPTGIIDTWLGWATPGYINPAIYGSNTDQGVMLWTCHVLTRTADGAAVSGGAVTKDQVGPATRETAEVRGYLAATDWGQSGYGQQLLALARRYTAGGFIV